VGAGARAGRSGATLIARQRLSRNRRGGRDRGCRPRRRFVRGGGAVTRAAGRHDRVTAVARVLSPPPERNGPARTIGVPRPARARVWRRAWSYRPNQASQSDAKPGRLPPPPARPRSLTAPLVRAPRATVPGIGPRARGSRDREPARVAAHAPPASPSPAAVDLPAGVPVTAVTQAPTANCALRERVEAVRVSVRRGRGPVRVGPAVDIGASGRPCRSGPSAGAATGVYREPGRRERSAPQPPIARPRKRPLCPRLTPPQ
jgi:hypothetical protein